MPKYHLMMLNDALEQRRQKNPRYSLRAFAAQLGVHPSALSRILQGKQSVSKKNAVQIIRKLGLSSHEAGMFLKSIALRAFQLECEELGAKAGLKIEGGEPLRAGDRAWLRVATDSTRVPEAGRRVARILEELTDFLKRGKPAEVYELEVRIVPVSVPGKGQKR